MTVLNKTRPGAFPPGPPGLPLIGNMLQYGSGDTIQKNMRIWREYGDIVYMKLGPLDSYTLFSPDYVNQVLVKNQKNYIKGMGYAGLRLMLGNGLVTSDGEDWRRDRRVMSPHFTPTAVAYFTEMMGQVIQSMLDRWENSARTGQPIEMDAEMMTLTMSVIGQAMFSIDLGEELQEIGHALRGAFAFIPERTGPGLPLSIPLPSHRRFLRNMKIVDDFIDSRIAQGRSQPDQGNLLSHLLKAQDEETGYRMSDRQLRDEIATLFFAGFETTARSLTWGWYLLAQHPEAADHLAAESGRVLGGRMPTAGDMTDLTYTRMVVDETLRLYPPTAVLARQSLEEDIIGDYRIPAGSLIILVPYAVHRYPAYWEDPERFDPERFGENSATRPKQAYIPFASGPRVCLGNSFALLEMVLTFAMASGRFRLERTEPGEIHAQFAGTVRPSKPLMVRVARKE